MAHPPGRGTSVCTRRSCSSSTRSASVPRRARWRRWPTSPATTGRAGGIARADSTPTMAASPSWRPRWSCCVSTGWPGPRSGVSAVRSESLLDAIGTPAGTLPSPAAAKPPGKSNSAARSGKLRSGRHSGRCARTAGGSSPTTGWRRSTSGTGKTPSRTRTCARTKVYLPGRSGAAAAGPDWSAITLAAVRVRADSALAARRLHRPFPGAPGSRLPPTAPSTAVVAWPSPGF